MAVTLAELDAFYRFAEAKINEKGSLSMLQVAKLWEAHEAVAEINLAIPDILSGHGRTIEEVDADIRAKQGWGKK